LPTAAPSIAGEIFGEHGRCDPRNRRRGHPSARARAMSGNEGVTTAHRVPGGANAATRSRLLLTVRSVAKSFGEMRAVDGVSFEIAEGSITGLIGPNGAGKTTLFNLLAGALPADSGTIHLGDTRLDRLAPHQILAAGLGRTFQIPRPFPEMSVLENVMIAAPHQAGERFWNSWLRPSAVRGNEGALRDRAMALLEFTTLAGHARTAARTLSGGQKARLSILLLELAGVNLLLLAEPTDNLDLHAAEALHGL